MNPFAELIITFFFGMFGLHRFLKGQTGSGLLYLFTGGLFGIGWIIDVIKSIKNLNEAGLSFTLNELPIVSSSGIMLNPDEVCHYQANASSIRSKNVVTGYTSGSVGMNFRIAKGVSIRTGSSKGAPIRQNVVDSVPGMLYITNQRILFLCSRDAFDKPYSSISAINISDDILLIQFGNKSYCLSVSKPKRLNQILTMAINKYSSIE